MHSTTLSLAILALPFVSAFSGHVPHPFPAHRRAAIRRRAEAAQAASNLAPGSLSAAEGCKAFARPVSGDSCYSLIADVGIELDAFRALNPQIDGECHNLWAGYDYCVSRKTAELEWSSKPSSVVRTSARSSTRTHSTQASTSAHTHKPKSDKILVGTSTSSASTTTTTTTSAAPTATASVAEEEEEEDDDDDGECDADDDEDEDSDEDEDEDAESSTSAVSSKVTTTTAAPSSAITTTSRATETSKSSVAPSSTTGSNHAASTSSVQTELAALGVTAFLGLNGDSETAIGSWYDADSSQDSTNGHSWCGFPYTNETPGFAPSLATMVAAAGGDAVLARETFCGLEAVVTTPSGESLTLVLADAFDDAWLITPSSIDIMHGAFTSLYGSATTDKDIVIKGVVWTLTGARNTKYKYNGEGDS